MPTKRGQDCEKTKTKLADCCLDVAELSVKKSHQRQGIASALLRWGKEYATELGLPVYVEATPDGVPVYRKFGYETVETFSMDLTKYGGKGPYTELGMRLSPPPKV
jgi:GNAT superfamily N-acetyltransferase